MPILLTETPGKGDEVVFTLRAPKEEAAALRRILTGLESLSHVGKPLPKREGEPFERLRQHRLLRNLTQKDLADAVGSTQSHLSKYEAGLRKIPPETAERLAHFFQCDVTEFLE